MELRRLLTAQLIVVLEAGIAAMVFVILIWERLLLPVLVIAVQLLSIAAMAAAMVLKLLPHVLMIAGLAVIAETLFVILTKPAAPVPVIAAAEL